MATESAGFRGFSPAAIQFLVDLAANNDRSWFQPRKAEYERLLKEPMEQLVTVLADRFASAGLPLLADAKRSPFRIYRDTRFSKDKSPYKTHLAASFPWLSMSDGGRPEAGDHPHGNGGYFNFMPGEMYVGGGMWMPDKSRLDGFRRALVDEPERVASAIENPEFAAAFGGVDSHEMYKRVPPGWPADHPRADMFRWKDVVFGRRLSDDDVCSPELPDQLTAAYAAAMPVFRFLETLH